MPSQQHTAALDSGVSVPWGDCLEGLVACARGCAEGLLRRPPQAVEIAPVLRERVCARNRTRSDVVDIHTLLVRPDPGRTLKRTYKTIAQLGHGGFGSVYRAEYIPTGEERAVKIIPKPRDAASAEQVLVEVQALVTLDHPNIEKFFEFFEDTKAVCLVTELCLGGHMGNLDPYVDSLEEIWMLFHDVLAAVAYCHEEGVVHRDLKFENCLLAQAEGQRRRHAKIIDFGLSAVRPLDERQNRWMDEAVGTVYFIAPEVLRSSSGLFLKYGPECDMWSIGVMMYIVLTDQHPFSSISSTSSKVIPSVLRNPVRLAPLDDGGIDGQARDLILGLLEKNPARRLSAEQARMHRFFTDGCAEASSPSRTPRTSPKSMRGIFERICSFTQFSRFERAILTLVAHDARSRDVKDLSTAFESLDTTNAGWLSTEGLMTSLRARGLKLRQADMEAALEALDPDGDHRIQYTDWLAATIQPSALTSEKAMQEIFDFFDIHGVGKVSKADLVEVLGEDARSLEFPAGISMSGDADSEVSWEDFQKLIRNVAANLQSQVEAREAVAGAKPRRWSQRFWPESFCGE